MHVGCIVKARSHGSSCVLRSGCRAGQHRSRILGASWQSQFVLRLDPTLISAATRTMAAQSAAGLELR